MRELMSYLPENYPASRETAAFQEALQPEVGVMWEARDDLLAQLDPYSATWGLDYWEDALGLANGLGTDLDVRRRAVVAKLQGRAATTPQVVKDVAETLLGVDVWVIEIFDEYTVLLLAKAGTKPEAGAKKLRERLREIMPAHLDWQVVLPTVLRIPIRTQLGMRLSEAALPPRERPFLVVNQGRPSTLYDVSCDGTWLLMKDCYESKRWHSSDVNDYANSEIHSYLNSTFLALFDANIQAQIKQVKLPYRAGSGYGNTVTSGANGLSAKIFLLSGKEVALVHSYVPANEGEVLAYFQGCAATDADNKRVANLNGSAADWWLRSPCCVSSLRATSALRVRANGYWYSGNCSKSGDAIRPALILPSNLFASDDGSVSTNTAPTTPASISIPGSIHGGTSIEVSWSAVSDTENNLEGYVVEKSTDGGTTWAQIYQGGGTSTTNTVAFGTESVMYRVRAYDSEGLYSSYRNSAQVTVINNTAPAAPGSITVPDAVFGGGSAEVSWTASTDGENNLAGYALERRVDEGAWTEIFRGDALSFADTVTKGWLSVAWRVRAYDTENAYSGYTASEIRAVDNNTPPAITCDLPSGSSLGVKSEGFSVDYSVSDEDGDAVTVAESVDSVPLRSFAAGDGETNHLQVDGLDFMKLLNGPHTLAITASDDKASTVHRLVFTKSVTAASVSLAQPMAADAPISVCVLSVTGSIPLDAQYSVKVTNNGLDDAPVWEECTAAVKTGASHIFANQTAVNGFAFNFKLEVERGASGLGGYITSVQGGFQ